MAEVVDRPPVEGLPAARRRWPTRWSPPPLLILDEPTAGLDPNQIREVRELIRELGQEHTILLSTHILSEVEATCERALVIARGKLVAAGHARRAAAACDRARPAARGARRRASRAMRRAQAVARRRHGRSCEAPRTDAAASVALELADEADPGASVGSSRSRALVGAGLGVRSRRAARADARSRSSPSSRTRASREEPAP